MEETNDVPNEHQLWVSLSALAEGNLIGLLPRLIEEMLGPELFLSDLDDTHAITLPSDFEWRTKMYMKLLEKQRLSQTMEEPLQEENIVLHEWNIIPNKSEKTFCAPDAKRLTKKDIIAGPGPITWTVSDIAKAACLLSTPPHKTHFNDEQEMRRVYALIYDVHRYKSVLNQALTDVAFFHVFPELNKQQSRVWLLLYDMYHRSFKKRETKYVATASKMFAECGLTECEVAVWAQKVKLAAAIARLRIQHSALTLSELLPAHLRDEKFTSLDATPVTCWVNIRKSRNKGEISSEIEAKLGTKLVDSDLIPGPDHFKWDPHCPQFIVFHPSLRTRLAQSSLVKKHKLIVQNKSFCIGPATFGKIIFDLQLAGSVIQTHVNSPRTVAYLATLLSQNEKIKKLMAFSAGSRKKEYDTYFSDLGMKNILIYSEKLIDVSPDAHYLEEVIAIFATPPNSYSAVADPIELVCSRGGDLAMLEALTESEETKHTRERVMTILDEQKQTLRYAMSRPQIQFVLYETHSEIAAENDVMVQKTMHEINRLAKLHHATLQGKLIAAPDVDITESKEINNNVSKVESIDELDVGAPTFRSVHSLASKDLAEPPDPEEELKDVVVPDCDIFDTPAVPELCPSIKSCTMLRKDGCYLALMQRKQVTNMDNKYMIQMAEARGLFASTAQQSAKKGAKSSKTKKQEAASSSAPRPKRRSKNIEVDRIAAPTQASLRHSKLSNESESTVHCPKHCREVPQEGAAANQSRKWWSETTRHLVNLRTSLVKQKILPTVNAKATPKNIVNSLVYATQKIDEIVAKGKSTSTVPVFPKLRLTRKPTKKEKIPCPITVTLVKFAASGHCINLNC